jgi:hypothetical protein
MHNTFIFFHLQSYHPYERVKKNLYIIGIARVHSDRLICYAYKERKCKIHLPSPRFYFACIYMVIWISRWAQPNSFVD